MKHTPLILRSFIGLMVSIGLIPGCQRAVEAPVAVDVAQETLTFVMDSWKEGKSPDELLEESPPIFVQEREWREGAKLLDYQLSSDDRATGPNLTARVKLRLSKDHGDVIETVATYVINTSPKLFVSRNILK